MKKKLVSIYITQELKDKTTKDAKKLGLSFNAYITLLLTKASKKNVL